MSRGKRYNEAHNNKLNIKKVIAVVITLIVIVMFIILAIKAINSNKNTSDKTASLGYYTVYENGKWGVINSKGDTIIDPSYDEMITIPNPEKDVFIVTYDVNYQDGTYKSKAINSKNQQLFTNYDQVEAVQNQDKQNTVWYSTNCLKVEKDGEYGLIDFSGKVLSECQYDDITPIMNVKNSLITTKDGKKGLISETGTVIINNEYKEISALTDQYEDGYIVKNDDDKYGVIGTNKKILVPTEYDAIKNVYSDNIYVVEENGKLDIFNTSDNSKKEIDASDVKSIDGDNIIIKKSNKYGIITVSGESKLEPKYQDLSYAFANYYIAELNNKYGIIDTTGNTKTDFKYTSLVYRKDADFIEGQTSGNINSDLIDRSLTVKLSGIISEMNVNKGYMRIRINNDYKYYNFKFEEKLNTDLLTDNTLFLSKKDGKYGYINKDGIVIVNYIYDDATEQNESGYAAVKKDGKWGAIDKNGNIVVEPTLTLDNNSIINFIGNWHLAEDINAGYYTK